MTDSVDFKRLAGLVPRYDERKAPTKEAPVATESVERRPSSMTPEQRQVAGLGSPPRAGFSVVEAYEIMYRVPGKGGFRVKAFKDKEAAEKGVDKLLDKHGSDIEIRWPQEEARMDAKTKALHKAMGVPVNSAVLGYGDEVEWIGGGAQMGRKGTVTAKAKAAGWVFVKWDDDESQTSMHKSSLKLIKKYDAAAQMAKIGREMKGEAKAKSGFELRVNGKPSGSFKTGKQAMAAAVKADGASVVVDLSSGETIYDSEKVSARNLR